MRNRIIVGGFVVTLFGAIILLGLAVKSRTEYSMYTSLKGIQSGHRDDHTWVLVSSEVVYRRRGLLSLDAFAIESRLLFLWNEEMLGFYDLSGRLGGGGFLAADDALYRSWGLDLFEFAQVDWQSSELVILDNPSVVAHIDRGNWSQWNADQGWSEGTMRDLISDPTTERHFIPVSSEGHDVELELVVPESADQQFTPFHSQTDFVLMLLIDGRAIELTEIRQSDQHIDSRTFNEARNAQVQ